MATPEIAELANQANTWENVSIAATCFVFLGVLLESVTEFALLAKWTRLDQNHQLRERIAKIGLFVLLAALALEVPAGIISRNLNDEIQFALNARIQETIEREMELRKLTEDLGFSNAEIEEKLKAIKAKNEEVELRLNAERQKQARTRGLRNGERPSRKFEQRHLD